ncbi:sensor domain-containing protein [Mycobacterium sp.]|uniref:sensor domain-containing protein n=1 Tax=Mycobacterium sp. TaxID=1785 RepID=UPI0037CAC860
MQAAVAFPDAHAANNFVVNAAASWQKCANRETSIKTIPATSSGKRNLRRRAMASSRWT